MEKGPKTGINTFLPKNMFHVASGLDHVAAIFCTVAFCISIVTFSLELFASFTILFALSLYVVSCCISIVSRIFALFAEKVVTCSSN